MSQRTAPEVAGTVARLAAELGDRVRWHGLYDEVGGPLYDAFVAADGHEIREILQALPRTPGAVLELACGAGRLTLPLLAAGHEVTAVDRSGAMLELLRRRLDVAPSALAGRAKLVEGDMSSLQLGRRFAAVVLAATSITLLDDDGREGLYRTVREHLDIGAPFVLTVPDADEGPGDQDREVELTFRANGEEYVLHDARPSGSAVRYVSIVPARREVGVVPICTSIVQLLNPDLVIDELRRAGLEVQTSRVGGAGNGYGALLLRATPR